jgi:hypothetical protein
MFLMIVTGLRELSLGSGGSEDLSRFSLVDYDACTMHQDHLETV